MSNMKEWQALTCHGHSYNEVGILLIAGAV